MPLHASEHVTFRRFSDFEALDAKLRTALAATSASPLPSLPIFSCASVNALPPLPPKTLPWLQDETSQLVVSRRWAALQDYLEVALESALECPEAWEHLKAFLCL